MFTGLSLRLRGHYRWGDKTHREQDTLKTWEVGLRVVKGHLPALIKPLQSWTDSCGYQFSFLLPFQPGLGSRNRIAFWNGFSSFLPFLPWKHDIYFKTQPKYWFSKYNLSLTPFIPTAQGPSASLSVLSLDRILELLTFLPCEWATQSQWIYPIYSVQYIVLGLIPKKAPSKCLPRV